MTSDNPIVHGLPRRGCSIAPCCGQTWEALRFRVQQGDALTDDPFDVTCRPFRWESLAMAQWKFDVELARFGRSVAKALRLDRLAKRLGRVR